MRIGIFTDTFYPEVNGVATSCLNLAQELTAMGHEVHIFAPRCRLPLPETSLNIHWLPSLPLIFLKDRNAAFLSRKILREAKRLKFDVIHTNSEFMMGWIGRSIAKKTGAAFVHTYHTEWEFYTQYISHGFCDGLLKKLTRSYSRWWCGKALRVIVPTEKTKTLLASYGVTTPMCVIPSGMNIARFAPALHSAEERAAVRSACGVKEGERVLLNIGRLASEKNIGQVMRVFPRLHEKLPDVRFVIIGEGPMVPELRRMAEESGVADSVTLAGAKPWQEIDRWYQVGDVFVSASHTETQGLTYIEAMAAGLCVCAVKDPCLDGVIEDGVSGILSGDSDEELLAALLRSFSEEGRRAAAAAPAAAAPYDTRTFANRAAACYEQALAAKRS